MEELYKKHRPRSFKEVIGQDAAIKSLVDMGKRDAIPHCILFTGPSGVGKTTIARILRHKLKCGDIDYQEMNASSKGSRGIDAIAQIQANMNFAPIGGKSRVWMIDEAHQLTGDAQNSLLKTLEDTPFRCYFMLSTTDPQKLKKTIITRSHEVKLKALSEKDLFSVVEKVAMSEGNTSITDEVMEKLIDAADGSARKALVLLHSIIGLESEEEQLDAISKGAHKQQAIEIARMLLKGTSWTSMAKVLKDVDEEPESLRWMILGYCKSVLLGTGGNKERAAEIIDRMQDHFYDSKQAGLVLACWDLIEGE
jgi:DNA polymerase-3 subunit gamma/tau